MGFLKSVSHLSFFCFCFTSLRNFLPLSYIWCSHWFNMQAEAKIIKGPHEDVKSYLEAIDQLRRNIRFFNNKKGFKNDDGIAIRANNLIAEAISKLEEEFKRLLSSYRFVFIFLMLLIFYISTKSSFSCIN